MLKTLALAVLALSLLFPLTSQAQGTTVTGNLNIIVGSPLAVVFTPITPSIACSAAPGTVVSAVTTTGGNSNPVTLAMTGDTTDFTLTAGKIVVAAAGITTSGCGKTDTITITATQP